MSRPVGRAVVTGKGIRSALHTGAAHSELAGALGDSGSHSQFQSPHGLGTPKTTPSYFLIFVIEVKSYNIRLATLKYAGQWHLLQGQRCALSPLIPKHVHRHERKPRSVTQPPETTDLLSVSMDGPIPYILYKHNHTVCDLLCLASLTWHDNTEVHPQRRLHQSFPSCDGRVIFHAWLGYILFNQSSIDGLSAMANSAAMDSHVHVFVSIHFLVLLGIRPDRPGCHNL